MKLNINEINKYGKTADKLYISTSCTACILYIFPRIKGGGYFMASIVLLLSIRRETRMGIYNKEDNTLINAYSYRSGVRAFIQVPG